MSASFQELEEEEESSEESEDEDFQLQESSMLRTLDPKDWKVLVQIMCLCYRCTQETLISVSPLCLGYRNLMSTTTLSNKLS